MEDEIQIETLSRAERFYKNHLKNVSNYQRKNKEKMRAKYKRYFDKMKVESPEQYENLLQRRREYYHITVKPKVEKIENI